jgi:outer membrane protein
MKILLWLLALCLPALAAPEPDTLRPERMVELVRRHHPKMRAAALLTQLADAKVLEKEGNFDPQLFLGSDFLRYNSPTDPGKAKSAGDLYAAVQMQDVSGMKLISGLRRNRGFVKSPDSLTGERGEFFLELKMPLLRGLGINEKQTALEQARVARQAAQSEARIVQLETLLAAYLAYWDWCAACSEFRLLRRALALAEQRARQVTTRVAAGDLARIDETEAQQEVQRRREAVAKAQRQVEKSLLKLSLYLWNSEGQADKLPEVQQAPILLPRDVARLLVPGGVPDVAPAAEMPPDNVRLAEAQALQLRPELSLIQFEKDIVELDRRLAENDRLPALDLTLGPGWDMGNQGVGLTYKAGLQLTIPLATRGPDGRLQAARLYTDKLGLDQVLEVQRILAEVRDAGSLVLRSQERRRPALESLRLALELEQAERTRFEFGDSTLFLVNQRERATLAEASKVVEIWADSLKGEALLEAAAGRL